MQYILIFLIALAVTSDTMAVKYSGLAITDDEIANAIRNPKPTSVNEVIQDIKDNHQLSSIEELILSNNNICLKGATQILEFATTLPHLKKISFFSNRIYDWRDQPEYETFQQKLLEVLKKDKFQQIDLRNNGVANSTWFSHIASKFDEEQLNKIKWTD